MSGSLLEPAQSATSRVTGGGGGELFTVKQSGGKMKVSGLPDKLGNYVKPSGLQSAMLRHISNLRLSVSCQFYIVCSYTNAEKYVSMLKINRYVLYASNSKELFLERKHFSCSHF
jgi:hypothetical protein